MNQDPLGAFRKFVRVNNLRADGFVEFDFAIGEPELFVELILPADIFDEFCAANKVTFLDERSQLKVGSSSAKDEEAKEWDWNLRSATQQRFR